MITLQFPQETHVNLSKGQATLKQPEHLSKISSKFEGCNGEQEGRILLGTGG
jgi:hypothetical protein